jgi:hypothetical protein
MRCRLLDKMEICGPLVALVAVLLATSAFAHHSYSMFEQREIKLQGTIKVFEWTNPHVFIQLLVLTADGQTEEWSIEGSGPGDLGRSGWKFNSLKAGEKVTVGVAPLKDGRKGGGLIFVQKEDNTRLRGGPLSRLDPDSQRSPAP